MGLINLDSAIDEDKLVEGITAALNRLFTRAEDEILNGKKLVVTVTLEDKNPDARFSPP